MKTLFHNKLKLKNFQYLRKQRETALEFDKIYSADDI